MAGRKATTNIIPGDSALSVNNPGTIPPEDWLWVSLNKVARMATGHTPSRNHPEYWGGDISWIAVGDCRFKSGTTILETKECTNKIGIENSAAVLLPKGTVCLSRTGSIGYVVIMGKEMATSQGFVNWICSEILLPRFLQLLFMAERSFLYRISEGTAHTTIYFPEVKAFNICLPPLPTQRAIVAKIEELFSDLDKGIADLKKAQDQLKVYRQAVLINGCSGNLSKKKYSVQSPIKIGEPEKNKEYPDKWGWVLLPQIAKLESGHTPRKTVNEYWENGDVPWICLQDIRAAHGTTLHDTKYHPTMLGIDNSSARILPSGTVCFSRDISVGFVTIMGCEMATTQHFANWICSDRIYNTYLMYAFMASKESLINRGQGTTVKTIYMPELKQLHILLPTIFEQHQIVQEIESRLSVCDKVEESITESLEKAKALRQSILKKAFEGTLLLEEEIAACKAAPDYEPASVLLEKIKAEKKK